MVQRFAFKGTDVAADIRDKYGFDGDLLDLFVQNDGPVVHKWHHYIPLYDRYFSRFRGTPVRFLEIGVSKGGSLQLWRRFFGESAIIFGIDIDPACAAFDGQAGQVRIGSQDDPNFLEAVLAEMGGVDVVLDDGSHVMAHMEATYRTVFPHLSLGGVYMIEDLHTAYWKKWGGGLEAPENFFNVVRRMIDDMHVWYHNKRVHPTGGGITGLHVHDSLVVLEKEAIFPPVHSEVGG